MISLRALFGFLLTISCCVGGVVVAAGEKPVVVVTNGILADWTQRVAGDAVVVRTLVPPGGDAHHFEPKVSDRKALLDARLVVTLGLGYEPWLAGMAKGSKVERVELGAVIPHERLLGGACTTCAHGHAHEAKNPHVWMDPMLAALLVERLRDTLAGALPESKERFAVNAAAYVGELKALDSRLEGIFKALPAERRRLVSGHASLNYFCRRYGIEIVDMVVAQSETLHEEVTAKRLVAVAAKVRALPVPCVYTDSVTVSPLVARVAREAGDVPVVVLPVENLTPSAPTYLKLVEQVAGTIRETQSAASGKSSPQ